MSRTWSQVVQKRHYAPPPFAPIRGAGNPLQAKTTPIPAQIRPAAAQASAAGSGNVPPPPVRWPGAPAQAKSAAETRGNGAPKPPPTRFGGTNGSTGSLAKPATGFPPPGAKMVQGKIPAANPLANRANFAPSHHPFGNLIQKMDNMDSDYVDSDEEREKTKRRKNLKREDNRKKDRKNIDYDYDDELENDNDDDCPRGYMSVSAYLDNRNDLRGDLEGHGNDHYWVRP
jgi:hypothetical protein